MTTKYFALLTNQGAAKLANAAALGTKVQITQMGVGDGGGALPTPTGAQTALIGEKRRAVLNALSVDAANNSQIIAEQIIPENEGGFWIREIGLYDSENTLIAVANCPETYKPLLAEGSGRTQTVRMILIINSTDAVTLKIDPSVVLATRKYVDDKAIEVKAYTDKLLKEKMTISENGADIADASVFRKNVGIGGAGVLDVGKAANTVAAGDDSRIVGALQKSKNGADIVDASAFRKNVGIGGAGLLDVGKAANTVAAGDDSRIIGAMQKGQNGADITDVSAFRKNVGIGGAGVLDVGKAANTVAAGDDSRIVGAMQKNQNGKDILDAAAFRQNLALKSAALRDTGVGAGQIPDMSAFQSGAGWVKFPDGTIIQRGVSISGSLRYPAAISLPIPFTQPGFVITTAFDSALGSANDCPAFAATAIGLTGFYLMSSRASDGNGAGANWIAIGK